MSDLQTPCRTAFEAWAKGMGWSIDMTDIFYSDPETQSWWFGFRAGWTTHERLTK